LIIRCPRFVEQVKFEIYNRWGEQVYTSASNNGGSLNIEWKGIDSKGRELGAGVYFYTAEVQFNVSDPTKQFKEYRGWVKLVR
jgi:flagellar hook assembly protein FlgD